MSDTAWKRLERVICRALGGERRGPTGITCSDCTDDVPWAVEIKRSLRGVPEGRWIEQARAHGNREGKPWLLVVNKPRSARPVVLLDFYHFAMLAEAAGAIGRGEPDRNPLDGSSDWSKPSESAPRTSIETNRSGTSS